jgi:hypothetical protein
MDTMPAAGRERARGERHPASELTGSGTAPIKDKGISSIGDRYNSYVRALPSGAKADLDPAERLSVYERALEDVIRKEEIPDQYREFVKSYFLTIGMGRQAYDTSTAP